MLTILKNEKRTHFSDVITGDESWFFFEYCRSSQWVFFKDDLIAKTQKTKMEKKITRKLTGVEHDLEESIKSHIFEILDEFEPDSWQSLFNSWIEHPLFIINTRISFK